MQSAAQRRSSSKNLRNCENIANMASGYENWRSRLIFNMLSTALWRGWEMLRVRLRFRMKGRVWYHLGNWGKLVKYTDLGSRLHRCSCGTAGHKRERLHGPSTRAKSNMTNKFVPCLVGRIHKKFCWNMLNNSEHRIQHHSTYKHLKISFESFTTFTLFVFHSATPLAYGNGGAALQLWGRKSWRRASLSACACHDRDITLRLLICGGEKMCFYLFSWTKV